MLPADAAPLLHPDPDHDLRNTTGAGVALLDVDGDGRLEIYQTIAPSPGAHGQPAPNRLWCGDLQGGYVDRAAERGVADPGFAQCVAKGDVNGDGHTDLFVGNVGADTLLVARGDGTFESRALPSDAVPWTTAAVFFDHDGDGDQDLFVVHYVDYDPAEVCTSSADGHREYCGPQGFFGTSDRLLENDGTGRFVDVSARAGLGKPGKGLGVVAADLTGDGRLDLYVANDGEANHLWVAQPDGTYREEGVERGAAFNEMGAPEASMGAAVGDVAGDGVLNVLLTHLSGETNTFLAPASGGALRDATTRIGAAPHDQPHTGFGCAFGDFDLDGELDLAVANGRVTRDRRRGGPAPDTQDGAAFWSRYAEPDVVFLGAGAGRLGAPRPVPSDDAPDVRVSRGLATGDLDGDGDLDLVVAHVGGELSIYRNDTPPRGRHWLRVRARIGATDAPGSVVRVTAGGRTRAALVSGTVGYASAGEWPVHFGLGAAARFEHIDVTWPDGTTERFPGGATNRTVEVTKGRGTSR